MPKIVTLAHAPICLSDEIRVEVVAPNGWPTTRTDPDAVLEEPPRIRIIWPDHPTITTPDRFPEVAGAVTMALAKAVTELSRIKARRYR